MRGDIVVNGKKMTATELVELYLETKNDLTVADQLIEAKQREISELESELRVKEELLKIKSGLKSEEIPDSITIDGYKCQIIQTEQGLYISRDDIYRIIEYEKRDLRERIEKQERRYQNDCITINQLHTTIDVLTDKLARLREVKGL